MIIDDIVYIEPKKATKKGKKKAPVQPELDISIKRPFIMSGAVINTFAVEWTQANPMPSLHELMKKYGQLPISLTYTDVVTGQMTKATLTAGTIKLTEGEGTK